MPIPQLTKPPQNWRSKPKRKATWSILLLPFKFILKHVRKIRLPKIHLQNIKFKKIIGITLVLVFFLFLFGAIALAGAVAYFGRDLPDPNRLTERVVSE